MHTRSKSSFYCDNFLRCKQLRKWRFLVEKSSMEAKYSISEKEFLSAARLHMYIQCGSKIKLNWLYLPLVIGLFFYYFHPPFRGSIILLSIPYMLFSVCLLSKISKIALKRTYRREAVCFKDRKRISVEEEGIRISGYESKCFLRWHKIQKWRQDKNCLVLFLSPSNYVIIPKSIGDSGFDLAGLQMLLHKKVGKVKRTPFL